MSERSTVLSAEALWIQKHRKESFVKKAYDKRFKNPVVPYDNKLMIVFNY